MLVTFPVMIIVIKIVKFNDLVLFFMVIFMNITIILKIYKSIFANHVLSNAINNQCEVLDSQMNSLIVYIDIATTTMELTNILN